MWVSTSVSSRISRKLPVTVLLAKDTPFVFTNEYLKAFNTNKEALITTYIIEPPIWSFLFEIIFDTSDHAVGVVFGQQRDKKPYVIDYASKTLDEAQQNYTTTEKEWLAVVYVVEKFRIYRLCKVIIFTDHSALKHLLDKLDSKLRLIWWVLRLQEFALEMRDKKGTKKMVADHLSRLPFSLQYDEKDDLPIDDSFSDEQLLALATSSAPWYADLMNYLACGILPPDLNSN